MLQMIRGAIISSTNTSFRLGSGAGVDSFQMRAEAKGENYPQTLKESSGRIFIC